ncbi:uncharacterized protein LOC114165577 [Vigna unguiculata]|uniref:uncharacterized protein LOC114165577 n=1 Tax=Vigna unguiculata TaxID=3917 RepID=UPI001015CAB0|nr:uncharacterized protein LOC114165577 [Vigna unguiculata]
MTGSSKNQDKLEATMNQLLANQRIFQEEMTNRMTNLEAQVLSRHNNGPESSNNRILPFSRTTVKLDIPRFDGSNPLSWIFQITQYFDLHNIPEEQRLQIASFSMEGEALNWFQWMHANNQLTSWATFIHCLEIRFVPSHYEDPKGALFKLCQTTNVREYQAQFESLANRIVGLPPPFFLSCFVSGLKPEIRREVQAFQPISLSQAISLAKLQEDKFADIATSIRSQRFTPIAQRSVVNTDFPSSKPVSIRNSSFPPQSSPNTNNPPIKRLSTAELQNRREKGLCYYCDDKYKPGHKCKKQFMLLIAESEDAEGDLTRLLQAETQDQTDPPNPLDNVAAQISFNALLGHSIPRTLRVLGHIQSSSIAILVDSGSTHNFIQDRKAKFLGLQAVPAQGFHVLVGNGEELSCKSVCKQVPLHLGTHKFLVDLFVLPLSGAELVLGVQWLTTLGPLEGQTREVPQEASSHQLRRLMVTDGIAKMFQLQLIPSPMEQPCPQVIPDICDLHGKYPQLFAEPHGLPPIRETDHHIPLLEGSNPVNVRPYQYPYFQKHEIERQIRDMMNEGLIQRSTSAFSSPVLLVRKKDGTLRFCVDYRALNAITIKDRFPIPSIDELIDELHGTQWFSKLDLRFGYHQIRMSPVDIPKIAF